MMRLYARPNTSSKSPPFPNDPEASENDGVALQFPEKT